MSDDDVLREAADYFMRRDGMTYVVEALCQRRLTGEWPAVDADDPEDVLCPHGFFAEGCGDCQDAGVIS